MIGIYDYDFTSKTRGLSPPCLDAMKSYAYLLKNEPQQSIILDGNLNNLQNYDKVLFFSDKTLEELPKSSLYLRKLLLSVDKYVTPSFAFQ